MPSSNDIITIDGPAGSGKGTVAKMVAEKKGYSYLDTGAMYRTLALAIKEKNIEISNESMVNSLIRGTEIKTEYEKKCRCKTILKQH